jgi:hypothetical protein
MWTLNESHYLLQCAGNEEETSKKILLTQKRLANINEMQVRAEAAVTKYVATFPAELMA